MIRILYHGLKVFLNNIRCNIYLWNNVNYNGIKNINIRQEKLCSLYLILFLRKIQYYLISKLLFVRIGHCIYFLSNIFKHGLICTCKSVITSVVEYIPVECTSSLKLFNYLLFNSLKVIHTAKHDSKFTL